jgi:hypothetical protein
MYAKQVGFDFIWPISQMFAPQNLEGLHMGI